MEPNKLDKKFRKALQEREITPSPAAWDRLDAMLAVAEEKKAAPTYQWLYVAATIIGFIAIAIVFLSRTEPLVDVRRDEVVQNNVPVQANDSVKQEQPDQIALPKAADADVQVAENHPSKSYNNPSKTQNTKHEVNRFNPLQAPKINEAVANSNPQNQKSPERQRTDATLINPKNEQPNQLANPISNQNAPQIANLDANPKLGKTPIKVSPSNLLSEVDGELELSFREKVIHRIDKNYQTVKVALANRNQQINQ